MAYRLLPTARNTLLVLAAGILFFSAIAVAKSIDINSKFQIPVGDLTAQQIEEQLQVCKIRKLSNIRLGGRTDPVATELPVGGVPE